MKVKNEALLEKLVLRMPKSTDGYALNHLVGKCPQLDANSVYCNLLHCTHFATTSVAALVNNRLVGFISAYRPPSDPKTLFIWQVVVDEMVRGHGIAKRMLSWLVDRPSCNDAQKLDTTITLKNSASRALFESFARDCGASIVKTVLFNSDTHFAGKHEDEYLFCVSPLPNRSGKSMKLHLNEMRGLLRNPSTRHWVD